MAQENKLDLDEEKYDLFMSAYKNSRSNPKVAIILFDSLLNLKPDICQAFAPLGWSHHLVGNLNEAIYNYKKSIECNPFRPFCYYELSRIYRELEIYNNAEEILIKWLENRDSLPQDGFKYDDLRKIYSDLGQISRSKNQYQKSVEYLTEAIDRCYNGEEYKYCDNVFYLRADSYSRIDEPEKALEDILVHGELNPEDRATLVLKGEILQQLEKHEESNEILMEYLLNPTNKGENWVNYMIGYNYNRLKEFEKSCGYLREAERLGYENVVLSELLKDCKP